MPKGLVHERDRGMDGTRDWGRLYWGGALFWLLADVEIRQQSDNRRSLRDALRAVLAAGGNTEEAWSIERFLAEADRPLPHPVLAPLYQRMGKEAPAVDLPALWKRLGVSLGPKGAVFDDRAPLAAIRRGITGR
jgi:predicted metalloprotease with PDZ domain